LKSAGLSCIAFGHPLGSHCQEVGENVVFSAGVKNMLSQPRHILNGADTLVFLNPLFNGSADIVGLLLPEMRPPEAHGPRLNKHKQQEGK
jgi:hypothetical protein